jgi:hypothetical protein
MLTIFAVPIALALLTGGVWAKELEVGATRAGVHKLCGGPGPCKGVQCGETTCDGQCTGTGRRTSCTITIHAERPRPDLTPSGPLVPITPSR